MKPQSFLVAMCVILLALAVSAGIVTAQGPAGGVRAPRAAMGTAFTYQGQLKSGGSPVNGTCDFQFGLWNDASAGSQIGATQNKTTTVTSGLFTIPDLDFGSGAFTGDARWLAIAVRCPTGSGSYTALTPRQPLTPAPYALALPGLYTQQNTTSPNIIGGYSGNFVYPLVAGATIGGGGKDVFRNEVDADFATIGGGSGNFVDAWGKGAFIGGGGTDGTIWNGNIAAGKASTIAGGLGNEVKHAGLYAAIPGGRENVAQGVYSFAAGYKARALHDGSFVWSDSTGLADSTGNDQFLVHASGGIHLYPATGGCSLTVGSSGWSCSSDRTLKENLQTIDPRGVLERVSRMPITRWNSKGQDAAIQHLGPMAQDFYAAFGLGEDDTHISTTDAQGVALAAIQGLYQIVQEKDAQVAGLTSQVASQRAEIDDLKAQVAELKQSARTPSSPFALPEAASAPLWVLVGLIGYAVFQRTRKEHTR